MKSVPLHTGWTLSHFDPATNKSSAWKPTRVPGCVQTSPFGLARKELFQGTRIREVQWMQHRVWIYRRTLAVPKAARDETIRLVFGGLDYIYEIRIDDRSVVQGTGMFHEVVIPLDFAQGKRIRLEVRLSPPPQTRETQWETTKAQFGRGWDFAPELRTIGIWDEVRLEVVPSLRVLDLFIDTRLENSQRARVTVHAEISEPVESGWAHLSLCGVKRRVPLLGGAKITAFIEIESPELWWPHGLGAPTLHNLVIDLEVPGRRTLPYTQKIGLREVARLPAQGQRPIDTPLQFTINQVPFFINGMNWVPPDSLIGHITPEQYDRQLEAFASGHVNLVRVWGGGLREKRHFYQRCDALGLLVFQEYPIACGLGTSEAFFRQLQSEARHIARALRRHPSVFLFSGGNENYHYWEMLDSDDPHLQEAARLAQIAVNDGKPFGNREWLAGAVKRYDEPVHLLLGGVTADLAPNCLYQNTSPMEGEGEVHGIWTWNPQIGDHRYRGSATLYDYWLAADQHLYSEASVSSIANAETIRDVTGQRSDRLPATTDETWNLHHAFHGAWDKYPHIWLDLPSTEKIFGPIRSLRELIVLNQYLQGEGGRFMIEELRRKQPRATGVIWWGVNEPWPGLAGNALIDYFGRRKLSWPMITNAFSPTILSLRYAAIQPRPLRGELWISCNARAGFNGHYRAEVLDEKNKVIDAYEGKCAAGYLESQPLRRLVPVKMTATSQITVKTTLLDATDRPVHENVYLFGNIRKAVLRHSPRRQSSRF